MLALVCSLWSNAAIVRAAATQSPVPQLDGYVNDFALVLDAQTKRRIETILVSLKQQAGVEFAVVTVKTTGGEDVFDYSQRVAREWGINGRADGKKSALLLLVSVDDLKSFTQMSKAFASGLPDGLIGEMNSRMRAPLSAGNFNEGLMKAVQTIVATLAVKRGLAIEGMEEKYAYGVTPPPAGARVEEAAAKAKPAKAAATENTEARSTGRETGTPKGEMRERKSNARTSKSSASKSSEPATESAGTAAGAEAPAVEKPTLAVEKPAPAARQSSTGPRKRSAAGKQRAASEAQAGAATVKAATPKDAPVKDAPVKSATAKDETAKDGPAGITGAASDDPLKMELSNALALAPAERIEKLKAFIEAHPDSALKRRAAELIVSAHAALGDEKLKAGDAAGGAQQFRLAINESPANMSDQLFAEVVSQLPFNLFVRGERAAAVEAARLVEEKVKDEPKRLLAVADFYLGIEDAEDAARVSGAAIKLAPEMADAHAALGASRRIALKLDEAATEYARALELDQKAAGARRSLADLRRATGKPAEALALYREQLKTDAADKQARAGVVLSLLELGQKTEAESELAAALKDDPNNLALLAGAAYWYAAHGDEARSLELAQQATQLEPRYTWGHIAMARALVQLKRAFDAERSLRFARQYGRFPTLDYELASVLAATGLYEEAADELKRSFTLRDGEIEAQLAGHNPAHAASFIELLAPERRASIFQPAAADTESNARMLKGLLALSMALNSQGDAASIKEAELTAAVRDFTAGEDTMRAYRQLYAASRLLQRGVALSLVLELTEAATGGIQAALTVPTSTIAVQADELRGIRAQAIASGGTPNVAEAPRNVLSNIMRGRLEDLAGWALFNQDKVSEGIVRLRRAVSVLPEKTPASQLALWHLGTALAASGNQQEALNYYFKSYNSSGPDPVRRAIIEALYKKVNGSLDGLDEKIGPTP